MVNLVTILASVKGREPVEKEKFLEKLQKLVEVGKVKKAMDINEIQDFFGNEELSKEQMDHVITYLEHQGIEVLRVMSDDLTLEDIQMLYRVFIEENAEEEDKEEIHRELLEQLYDMAEERPKDMLKAAKKVQNYLEK